jgi:hypothetical protein
MAPFFGYFSTPPRHSSFAAGSCFHKGNKKIEKIGLMT